MRAAIHAIQLLFLLPLGQLPSPAGSSAHRVDEVVDHHPSGELRRRYEVNEDGQKHGAYAEYAVDGTLLVEARYSKGEMHGRELRYFASGKKEVVASWSAGQLHGRYESFYESGRRERSSNYKRGKLSGKYKESSEDGDWVLTAAYKEDLLDGALTVKDRGKTLTKQKWKAGRLLEIDGIEPFPRTRESVLEELASILAAPEALQGEDLDEAPEETDPIAGDRAAALRRLQAYRALCNLPWDGMSLVPEWNALCDAASEICRRLGRLSHTPERPEDTDDELYRDGRLGASRSNLSMGSSLPGSVDSYMDDSDPSNIDRVGHRRWCLNPPMNRTGFGWAQGFSAMWSMDASGGRTSDLDAVLYPPPGYVPTEMFGNRHAWSITPVGGALPAKDKILVSIEALGDHYLPAGDPLEIDYLTVSRGGFGGGPCLIFRPDGLDALDGYAYRCRVSFDGGRTQEYDYIVEFVSDERLQL